MARVASGVPSPEARSALVHAASARALAEAAPSIANQVAAKRAARAAAAAGVKLAPRRPKAALPDEVRAAAREADERRRRHAAEPRQRGRRQGLSAYGAAVVGEGVINREQGLSAYGAAAAAGAGAGAGAGARHRRDPACVGGVRVGVGGGGVAIDQAWVRVP